MPPGFERVTSVSACACRAEGSAVCAAGGVLLLSACNAPSAPATPAGTCGSSIRRRWPSRRTTRAVSSRWPSRSPAGRAGSPDAAGRRSVVVLPAAGTRRRAGAQRPSSWPRAAAGDATPAGLLRRPRTSSSSSFRTIDTPGTDTVVFGPERRPASSTRRPRRRCRSQSGSRPAQVPRDDDGDDECDDRDQQ